MSSHDAVLQRVRELDRQYGLLPREGIVLAAVSGGADSMCMLHVLRALAPEYGFAIMVAHYHHGLRGVEADRDADFVCNICREWELPFRMECGDVAKEASRKGLGMEETGRLLRYDFLRRTAEQFSAVRITTAHHADDNAETILLHLVRGSGLQGLSGIAPVRGALIRPLLLCTRAEIEAYNHQYGIPHVEDSTNRSTEYSRNYLRHQVLPLLKTLNPSLTEGLTRTAAVLRTESDYLTQQASEILSRAEISADRITVRAADLTSLPEALRPLAVQLLFAQLNPDEILSSAHRTAVLSLAAGSSPSGSCNLPGGITARRDYARLVLESNVSELPAPDPAALPLPGAVQWGSMRIHADACRYDGGPQRQTEFCVRTEAAALIVRTRQAGDRLRPVGRPEKSLKKWMIDEKFPRTQRAWIPVLTDGTGTILGVLGLGVDLGAHPAEGEAAWRITLRTDDGKDVESNGRTPSGCGTDPVYCGGTGPACPGTG